MGRPGRLVFFGAAGERLRRLRRAGKGTELLDPDAPGTLLGPSAAVVYRGVRYEVVKSGLPFASQLQTRYNPPHELGLRLYKVPSDPEHYRPLSASFRPRPGCATRS